jgi:hypothetical protein
MGYAPTPHELTLARAVLCDADQARPAAATWLDEVDFTNINEGLRRLIPLLYHRLSGWGMDHPKLPILRADYKRYWLATRRIQFQSDAVLNALAGLDAPVILLKGSALGRTVYPLPVLRPYSDIDLLFKLGDYGAARDMLLASGFRLEQESWHSSLLLKDDALEVDLHLSPYHEAFSEPLIKPLFSRLITLPGTTENLYRLGHEDQMLHTLAHGLRSNPVSPLRWMVDAMHILREPDLIFSWDLFMNEVTRLDLVEVAARGLTLLSSICPDEFDPEVIKALEGQRTLASGLRFKAEREWKGPSVIWGNARRNGDLLSGARLFMSHYGKVGANEGARRLVVRAFSRSYKMLIGAPDK